MWQPKQQLLKNGKLKNKDQSHCVKSPPARLGFLRSFTNQKTTLHSVHRFQIYSDPQMMMTGASHKIKIAPDEFQIPRVITPFPAPKLSHLPMVLYCRLFAALLFFLLYSLDMVNLIYGASCFQVSRWS